MDYCGAPQLEEQVIRLIRGVSDTTQRQHHQVVVVAFAHHDGRQNSSEEYHFNL
jgi:hypothetical protein